MKFLQVVCLLLMVVSAKADKIAWTDSGHPIMSQTDRPIEGCYEGGFVSLREDSNSSADCIHK